MKKSTKVCLILLIVGTMGLAVMLAVVMGSGTLFSREATKSYTFDESPSGIQLDTKQAQVELIPSEECRVEAYTKAWRSEEINMDDLVKAQMEGDELVVTETPFGNDFIGFFPQPYELKLTIYAPQSVCDVLEGGAT